MLDGPYFQIYWEKILKFTLHKMNIGSGESVESSGESYVIDYILDKLHEPLVIFDVGANIGDYTLSIAGKLDQSSTIYCFEPSKKTFDTLSKNVKNKNARLFNFGFGSKTEELRLYSNQSGSGLASVYKRRLDHFDIYMDNTEKISLKTLDEFTAESQIKHINLLKIDVEGHEYEVLSGAKSLLKSDAIDFIQFEFGGCNIDSRTYFQDFFYMLNPNFKIYRILNNGFFPIPQYQEIYEQFATTNFLAVSKKI
jgi:FkbM family methyltransferase